VLEILHRHAVEPGDGFRMEPSFVNFQSVAHGELLARAGANGEERIEAPRDGVLIMPLYQGQGQDGFFLGRRVRPFWLHLSTFLRRLRLGSWLHVLPGVRRVGAGPDALEVDRRVARFLSRELFHLFGYRRVRAEGELVFFTRRVEQSRP
jgi:succinylglutamate desuccinylase